MGVSVFKEKFLIKDSMCGVENGIFLCIAYKTVSIVLIPKKYHQFRMWCEFVGTNFNRKEYIGSIAKDTKVQCLGFVL